MTWARPWLLLILGGMIFLTTLPSSAGPDPATFWSIDDVRPGMKGYGRSVFRGTTVERFDAEVLGVLKSVSPGRDLVLMRLSGCNLDRTGVIAGMSGSPVYIDGKLLGAVSYAWAFGTEPIAGVTPFSQMTEYVESHERRDLARQAKRAGVRAPESKPRFVAQRLPEPLQIGGRSYNQVTVAASPDDPVPAVVDGLFLMPLKTPLVAGGFTQHSLELIRDAANRAGLVPMQGGSAAAHLIKDLENKPLEPGAPLAIALVTGDFDMSGIGTVTHIEGERVYGWGHPFMSVGTCEFPLMSGHIHTVYPRRSVSFKMGSPIKCLGVITADVSTGVAGWLNRKPDMLPLKMTVSREPGSNPKTFRCEVVRQKSVMPQMVYATLTNSVDTEGELPEELTAEMEARIEFEDRPPLVIHDTYSGPSYSGGRAPGAIYSQVASMIHTLIGNPFEPIRIKRIDCATRLSAGRISAEIDAVQLDSETYLPGDTVRAVVFLKPYKGTRQRVPVRLKLPTDLAEGTYSALICDDFTNTRLDIRESPVLNSPANVEQVLDLLATQAAVKRTNLVVRVPIPDAGVVVDGQPLPNLPASMVEMLANSRRTGAQTMAGALVSTRPTDWVIQGQQTVKFTVTKNKRVSTEP